MLQYIREKEEAYGYMLSFKADLAEAGVEFETYVRWRYDMREIIPDGTPLWKCRSLFFDSFP